MPEAGSLKIVLARRRASARGWDWDRGGRRVVEGSDGFQECLSIH